MFVQNLNEAQQAALLHLSHQLIHADGDVADEEEVRLSVLKAQAVPGLEPRECTMEELGNVFDSQRARVSALLELIGLGYADRDFDPAEQSLVRSVADAFGVEGEELEEMQSWVVRQMHLVHEAESLMEA